MALKWRKKVLLLKPETTYGVDATPTGAANAILARNIRLNPMEGSDVSRDLETPVLGAQPTVPTELHMRIQFDVELAPSGTAGTAPAWGPILRACAVAETISAGVSVTYNPISDNHESATIYLNIDSTKYAMLGARGTSKIDVNAQGIPYLQFDMTGLFVQPADQAAPTPDLVNFQKPLVATTAHTPTFTLAGTDLVLRKAMLDLGNDVQRRFLIGKEEILITDKAETFEATVEAVDLATFNPFQLAADQTDVAVQLIHGTAAGSIATLDIPTAQMQRPQGLEGTQNIKEWPLRMVPIPSAAGNDQWTLTLT
ncbi:MAG: phage tail tube protein [Paracoccaceae bacterium]